MENKLLQALLSHYQCEIHKAEADLLIYFKSPIGKALIGKILLDMVTVETPAGERNFEILEVNYI